MNDIFNTDVPLKTETPAFAKHVLPAVPLSEVYLEDCVTALKRYADNHFDLAIVDPPYGIGMDSTHFITKSSNANANNYGKKDWDAWRRSGIRSTDFQFSTNANRKHEC